MNVREAINILKQRDERRFTEELARLADPPFDLAAQVEGFGRSRQPTVPVSPQALIELWKRILPVLLRRAHYDHVRQLAGGPPPRSVGDTLREAGRLYAGVHGDEAVPIVHVALRNRLADELAEVNGKIEQSKTPMGGSPWAVPGPGSPKAHWAAHVDGAILTLSGLVARREDLSQRVQALSKGGPDPAKASGSQFRKAIAGMGGPKGLASRVVEARKATGVFYAAADAGAALADAKRANADIEQLVRTMAIDLADAKPETHAFDLARRHREIIDRIATITAHIEQGHGAAIDLLVERASRGDRLAREQIVMDVRSYPAAFPEGLAEDLAEWRFDEEPLEAVIDELKRDLDPSNYLPHAVA